jgi:DNA-binding helix-hairpin-helix protein with protein kinase domain
MLAQPDLFGAAELTPLLSPRRRRPSRSLEELHARIDQALAAHRRDVEAAVETLRDALCEMDEPEIAAGIDALDDELTDALHALKRDLAR